MSEAMVWVLIWMGWNFSGFVSKIDEFPTQSECVQFAREVQSRTRNSVGNNVPGIPICAPRKAEQRAQTQKESTK